MLPSLQIVYYRKVYVVNPCRLPEVPCRCTNCPRAGVCSLGGNCTGVPAPTSRELAEMWADLTSPEISVTDDLTYTTNTTLNQVSPVLSNGQKPFYGLRALVQLSKNYIDKGATGFDNIDGGVTKRLIVCGLGLIRTDRPTPDGAYYVVTYQLSDARCGACVLSCAELQTM